MLSISLAFTRKFLLRKLHHLNSLFVPTDFTQYIYEQILDSLEESNFIKAWKHYLKFKEVKKEMNRNAEAIESIIYEDLDQVFAMYLEMEAPSAQTQIIPWPPNLDTHFKTPPREIILMPPKEVFVHPKSGFIPPKNPASSQNKPNTMAPKLRHSF